MSVQLTVTLPDDVAETLQVFAQEKRRSQSAIVLYLVEKGLPIALEELNKLEVAKKLIDARKKREVETED